MPRQKKNNSRKRNSNLSRKNKKVIKGGTQIPSLSQQLGIPECACCTKEKCKSWYSDDMPELGYNISQYSDENNSLAEQFLGGTNGVGSVPTVLSNPVPPVLSSPVPPVLSSPVPPVLSSPIARVLPNAVTKVLPNSVAQISNTPISPDPAYHNSNTQNLTNKLESESSKEESGFIGNFFKNIFGGGRKTSKKRSYRKRKKRSYRKRKNKSLKKK
jgi:hypothetical protein